MSSAEAVLEVDELSKHFHVRNTEGKGVDFVAVDDVSFSLDQGSSLAIVGESGSGKTTVARMLVGLETPSSGKVVVCGRDRTKPPRRIKERRERARELQIVFQDPYSSLDPRQRVNSALDEVLRVHFDLSQPERVGRVSALLDQVGLDERHGRSLPHALSGGQRQRVAIARALAAEPRLLVLDEAVAALDVSIQAQVLNLLADLREETGTGYVFISHDLAVVRQVTDTVLVMRDGKVVERGQTDQILDSPQDAYTQLLRNSVPRPGWEPRRRARDTANGTNPTPSMGAPLTHGAQDAI